MEGVRIESCDPLPSRERVDRSWRLHQPGRPGEGEHVAESCETTDLEKVSISVDSVEQLTGSV